jgi:hypothetical protein
MPGFFFALGGFSLSFLHVLSLFPADSLYLRPVRFTPAPHQNNDSG